MNQPDGSETSELPTGFQTMSPAMADMRAYPAYLFRQVAPYLQDRVWEIGVGHGTYTRWLRDADKMVLATDIDQQCLDDVSERFADDDKVQTAMVDLTDQSTIQSQKPFQANSILCLNVLEHIQDDQQALNWLRQNVAADAVMGLIVPAHPQLFGRMDSEAGHFRRYTRRSLTDVFQQAGWRIQQTRYLNVLGAAGWWYHNRWRKDAGLADDSVNGQMRSADRWLPRVARVTDPLTQWFAGLSVMAIAHAK
ncbi:MAG: class I SAM-dependent methyltransferase [Pirellulaceae bacterium]|nr:class I SAM-dependent methyltransferase [Pirellulaceae bacterium]